MTLGEKLKDIRKRFGLSQEQLASGNALESQYRDHKLNDNQRFKDCRECHKRT